MPFPEVALACVSGFTGEPSSTPVAASATAPPESSSTAATAPAFSRRANHARSRVRGWRCSSSLRAAAASSSPSRRMGLSCSLPRCSSRGPRDHARRACARPARSNRSAPRSPRRAPRRARAAISPLVAGRERAQRVLELRGAVALDQLQLLVVNHDPLHAETPARGFRHSPLAHRVQQQVAGDPEQPPGGAATLRVELIATLQRTRERLRDEIEHELWLHADAAAQVAAHERVAAPVQQREALGRSIAQQLLVSWVGGHCERYTRGVHAL